MKKKKVLLALSGGLDSAVSGALLKEQGYDCIAVYMNLWSDPTVFDEESQKKFPQNKCCSLESLMDARAVAERLDIPFYSVNFDASFKEEVVDYFLEGFRRGETPNPCVRCNKKVKFGLLFEKMKELDCDFLATGHYAMLETDSEGLVHLKRGADQDKDQTYFLYNLTQAQLKRIIFPIGTFNKKKVREMAHDYGLKQVEKKRESQGVCFYPEKTYFDFLKRQFKEGQDYNPGSIKNIDGQVIGRHSGLPFYTIGQRKGIGIGGGPALFVNRADKIKNVLIVGSEDDLNVDEIYIREWNFLSGKEPDESLEYEARVRSLGQLSSVHIQKDGALYRVRFNKSERAIMPGQSLVLYRDGELIGGGVMTEVQASVLPLDKV